VRAREHKPYTPNFNDPRVKSRIETALTWCDLNVSSRPKQIKKEKLEEAFGPIGNKLGDYLRDLLIIRSGSYSIEAKKAYQYALKPGGIEMLKQRIEAAGGDMPHYANATSPTTRIEKIQKLYLDELNSLDFKYELKSDRYWHPLQNLKRDMKPLLWNKLLPYNYDIEACAPTLLKQTAEKCGLLKILAGPIEDYLNDKGGYRERVAQLTGLDLDSSKRLINSFFNGARLAKNQNCMAYQKLLSKHSPRQANEAMERLQEDQQIKMLRLSIKNAWKRIESKSDLDLSTARKKWGLYFALERRVLDAMKDELERQGVKYFTEHDGFRANRIVDSSRVVNAVQEKTGFRIKLELTEREGCALTRAHIAM
jgi:hypothetical protein